MTKKEKNKLAEENLGLVYAVVNRKFLYTEITEIERENYIEEGMIGLVRAINTFNPKRGVKFSSYAFVCIEHEILRYINKTKTYKRKIQYACKKSLDEYIEGGKEKTTYKDVLIDERDAYSSLEDREEILNALEEMNLEEIKYIALKRAEGYTYEKIGNKIGVSQETIRVRLNKAKKELIKLGITV